MKSTFTRTLFAAAIAAALAFAAPAARADMTNDQVKELLTELKLIRQALEKGAMAAPQPGGQGAPADDKVSMVFPKEGITVGKDDAKFIVISKS